MSSFSRLPLPAKRFRRQGFLPVLSILFSTALLLAQNDSGTILGTVRDPQGAIVVSATVTVANVNTGVSKTTPVTQSGGYAVPFLVPGTYSVSVEAPGFKRSTQTGIILRVADQLVIDAKLDVGVVTEQVTVQATAPLVESASVTLGQVVETRRIEDLPLNGRDPTSLSALAPGVTPAASPLTAAQGGSIPSINGGNFSTSSVTVDGASDVTPRSTTYLLLFTPNVDAVAEFKVQTNSMSAEYGRTNGGGIILVTKAGTNQLHGTAYWFLRNSDVDANDFFSNRAGLPLGALRRNQAGFTAGGPVIIPKVYNGKDKTFFFVDYEAFREQVASPNSLTLPTALQRAGDFSQTFTSSGKLVQVFDPASTTPNPAVAGSYIRTVFPGNMIPANRLNPVAVNLMQFYPLPNSSAITGNYNINPSIPNSNNTFDLRMDQYAGAHHLFGRGTYQQPEIGSPNVFSNIGSASAPPLEQRRRQASLQDVYTLSPTLIVDLQYSIIYMYGHRTARSDGYDITQLGFPSYYAGAQEVKAIPVIGVTGYTGIGNGSQNYSTQTTHALGASMTKIFSRQRFKAGVDYQVFYNNQLQNSSAEGTLNFGTAFTQGPNPNVASSTAGNGMATFLLGYASGGIVNQPATAFRSSYQGFYAQDDINISKNLTLLAGVRWDLDRPRTERYDRISVLNLGLPSPIATQVPSLNLLGQMTYPGGDNRRLTSTELTNVQPRIGLTYRAPGNLIVRSSYGIFYGLSSADATTTTAFADGFSSTTNIVSSLDGVHGIQTLSNPYPNGITPPRNRSQLTPGLDLGQATNSALLSLKIPAYQQWNFTLQRSIGSTILLEAAYVGNKGSHVSTANIQLNTLTAQELALGTANQQLVPNPFYGVITDPTSSLSLATVARGQLLLPYPQYTTVSSEAPSLGSSIYHSMQAKVEKRFSKGYTFLAAYTLGKVITNATGAAIEDPNNLRAERSLANWDVTQRLVLSGVYELPFGRGKLVGSNWNGVVDALLGGWQVNTITTFQGGMPLTITSTSATRANRIAPVQQLPGSIASRVLHYFDTSAFAIPAAFTYGNAPATEPDVRGPGIDNTDASLLKNFRIKEKATAQLRFEGFNIFNRVQFANPGTQDGSTSFGVITAQQNQPRKLQVAVKIIF
jgi:hypothetical protein